MSALTEAETKAAMDKAFDHLTIRHGGRFPSCTEFIRECQRRGLIPPDPLKTTTDPEKETI